MKVHFDSIDGHPKILKYKYSPENVRKDNLKRGQVRVHPGECSKGQSQVWKRYL